jgi:hypothetical protein
MANSEYITASVLLLICFNGSSLSNEPAEILEKLSIGTDARGTFVSTNASSTPFRVISAPCNLAVFVGSKWELNPLNTNSVNFVTQYVPDHKYINRVAVNKGYQLHSGRFASFEGSVLTLTDFEIRVSDKEEPRGIVTSVVTRSISLKATDELLKKQKKPDQKL